MISNYIVWNEIRLYRLKLKVKLSTSAFGEVRIPIDIETCQQCRGSAKVIVGIEDPVVIEKLLPHLKESIHY